MNSSKFHAFLFISMLFISSTPPILACGHCANPHHHKKHKPSNKPIVKPPTTPENKCPIDTVKLGACVDLLGRLVHVGVGDPAINQCCPMLEGLVEVEAAACLCSTLKLKVLNLNIFVPIALQLLVACGKSPPPGYTCTL